MNNTALFDAGATIVLDHPAPLSGPKLRKLYRRENRSMAEIARGFGCSIHKIVYWMDRHGISRRSHSEATYFKRNRVEPFRPKPSLSLRDERLKALALGIYMGEGNKRSVEAVRVGNTDPALLRIFLRFLREICRVREERIRVNLVIHPDVHKEQAEAFWRRQLRIPRTRFQKTTVLKPRGRGTYRHRCAWGVATVCVSSVHLRQLIGDWLEDVEKTLG